MKSRVRFIVAAAQAFSPLRRLRVVLFGVSLVILAMPAAGAAGGSGADPGISAGVSLGRSSLLSLSVTRFEFNAFYIRHLGLTPRFSWFTDDDAGLARLDARGGVRVFSPDTFGLSSPTDGFLGSLAGAPDGSVWMAIESFTGSSSIVRVSSGGVVQSRFSDGPGATIIPIAAAPSGAVWASEVQSVIGADGSSTDNFSIVHVGPSGTLLGRANDTFGASPDRYSAGGGALASDGALWYWAGDSLVRYQRGSERVVDSWSGLQVPGSLVPGTRGSMWAGPEHLTPNDMISSRIRYLCGGGYVDSVSADARGRLWFTYKHPGRAAGVGYADKKLRVHFFSVPPAERSVGVRVFEGPRASIWLQGASRAHSMLTYLYRVDRIPASKTACQGLRG